MAEGGGINCKEGGEVWRSLGRKHLAEFWNFKAVSHVRDHLKIWLELMRLN